MYLLRVELFIIKFLESLAGYLPHPIASRLELLANNWRDMVRLRIMQEVEEIKKDVKLLRSEISEMKSATNKIKNIRRRSDRQNKG